nr:ribosomal-processing cysteine protease Prp [uncultured Cellulosilyticum sp.]
MIKVKLYQRDLHVYRIMLDGHAGYAEHGEDIVCAAVSMLVINTVNSIELFTSEPIKARQVDNERGLMDIEFPGRKSGEFNPDAELLIKSMINGLETVREMYGEKYIQIQKH